MNKQELESRLRELQEKLGNPEAYHLDTVLIRKLQAEHKALWEEYRSLPKDTVDLGVIGLVRKIHFEFSDGSKFSVGPEHLAYIGGKVFRITLSEKGEPLKAEGEILDEASRSMVSAVYAFKIEDEKVEKPKLPTVELRPFSRGSMNADPSDKPVLFPGDFHCRKCGAYNYKERLVCTKCGQPKSKEVAKSLGMGWEE
jgi:hypothetical protein